MKVTENKKEYIAPDAQIIPTDSVDTVAVSSPLELPVIPASTRTNGRYDF